MTKKKYKKKLHDMEVVYANERGNETIQTSAPADLSVGGQLIPACLHLSSDLHINSLTAVNLHAFYYG